MRRSLGVGVLLSLPSVGWAVRDATFYPDGVVNPNVRHQMYWNDASNVLHDLDKFSELFVRFHSCAWSPLLDGERKDQRVDENDYWYMNAMPEYGPNVAFSLYGIMAGNAGNASSPCGKETYINSFYTTTGFATFAGALSSLLDVPSSATQYPTGCEDAAQLVCGAHLGRSLFALALYSSDTCNPKHGVSLSVPSDLASLNRALTKQVQCTRIYATGDATPDLLEYSRACSLRDAVRVCPDPFGQKAMYERELARAIRSHSHNGGQSVLLGLGLCVAGLGLTLMAGLVVCIERRRAVEGKLPPMCELPPVTQKKIQRDIDDNESCTTKSSESDGSVERNIRCLDRIVEAVEDSAIDRVCISLAPLDEGNHQCIDGMIKAVDDSGIDKVCSVLDPCDDIADKSHHRSGPGSKRHTQAAQGISLQPSRVTVDASSNSSHLPNPYSFSIGNKSVTLTWSTSGKGPIKRSFEEILQQCPGGNETEVASDDSCEIVFHDPSNDDDSLIHSASSAPNDDETSFGGLSVSDESEAARVQKTEQVGKDTVAYKTTSIDNKMANTSIMHDTIGNILSESSSEDTAERWVAGDIYPPSKTPHIDGVEECVSALFGGQSATKPKIKSHDKKWRSILRFTSKKEGVFSGARQGPKRDSSPASLQGSITTFSTPIQPRMHFGDKDGFIISQNNRPLESALQRKNRNSVDATGKRLVTKERHTNSSKRLSQIMGSEVTNASTKDSLFSGGFKLFNSIDASGGPVQSQGDRTAIGGGSEGGSFRFPSLSLPGIKVQWPFAVENVNDDPSLHHIAKTVFDSEPIASAASDETASYIAVEALSGTDAALNQAATVSVRQEVADACKNETPAWFSGIFDHRKSVQPPEQPTQVALVSGYSLMKDGASLNNFGTASGHQTIGSDEPLFVADWSAFDAPSAGPSAFV